MTEKHEIEFKKLKLSDQALGALMMALQNSLLNQTDIVPVLKDFDFIATEEGLWVKNPPTVKFSDDGVEVATAGG